MNVIDIQPIAKSWQPFHAASDVGHIKDEAHYDRMVALADHLVDSGAANDGHDLEDLFLLVCDLIAQYDDKHYPAGNVTPTEMLRFLMTQHGLTQSDLPEIGTQGVVSEILRGKRDLNLRQIKEISARFNMNPAAFL
ncbi:helix-turn-helix domain-containing protein [Glaciimonas sp. GG7]